MELVVLVELGEWINWRSGREPADKLDNCRLRTLCGEIRHTMMQPIDRSRYWLMCGAGPYGPGRWGFRLESYDGQIRIDAVDEEPGAHFDQLALIALVRGLEAIDEPAAVQVLTPNRYIWQGISEGLDEWRENDWCWEAFGSLVPVKYLDLWQRVDRLRTIHDIECRAIPAAQVASVTSFVSPDAFLPESRPSRGRMQRIHFPATDEWPTNTPRRRRAAAREFQSA